MEKVDLKTKTALVYDKGLFMQIAERLGRDFGRVLYYNPNHKTVFPKYIDTFIGKGLKLSENVEWIEHLWDYADEVDVWVFPDTHDGDMQQWLRSQGKRVFGSGKCEELELLRVETLEYLEELGLPVPDYTEVDGLDNLREHLKINKDVYVKVDKYRGSFETFHSENYKLSEPLLDKLEKDLGPTKNKMQFSIFKPIVGVELAYDGYSIDGKYPSKTLYGIEIKDIGYIGHVKKYKDLFPEILKFNEAISKTLEVNQYRCFISPEMRVDKKGVGYMVDACCRMPSPVSECYYELLSNFSDIIWHGADGVLIEPEFEAEYAMTLVIESEWAKDNWQAVYFKPELRPWIKLRNYCKIDGDYYIVPVPDGSTAIGVVIAIGSSLEDCAKKVNEYADGIKGYGIKIECAAVDKMQKEIEAGADIGIKF